MLDQSRPTVRSIEVGTVEYADQRAMTLLSELGINDRNPSGFTYNNANVGTVSYQHGGGSDANTLAVINIDVKQLPGISQLRMVKELPANAATFGYYSQGDIVRKDGRLWICTYPALKEGDKTYFITLRNTHRTDNCNWGGRADLKYFKADRMSCNSYRANYFRLFLYGAAFVLAHRMKHTVFKGTEVERFNMDSIIRRIMLSAVHIVEKKTYIKISFSPHHRHREDLETALTRMAA